MEVLSSSFFSSTPSLNNLTKKTLLKLHKTHLNSPKIPPFSTTNFPPLNPKKPSIFARFRRPSKRRNSLRKKLTDDISKSQVSEKDIKFVDPLHGFVDHNAHELSLDDASFDIDCEKDGNFGNGSARNLGNSVLKGDKAHELNLGGGSFEIDGAKDVNFENDGSESLGNSVLRDKLETWVELYRKDIDFWGIGSNPIFIVFRDSSNGKVDKVIVDEGEILRRNGVDPLKFKDVSELEEFSEVKEKINHARFLAREMESGRDVIDRNCSVAKFVISGEGLGLVSWIKSVSVPKNVVVRVSKIGIGVIFGVLLVWTVKELLGFGGKEADVTGFEKEMLRRKMKARMEKEKEKEKKGSVEIVEDVSESPAVITKRPEFDKEAVLDGIRKVKGLSSGVAVVNAGGSLAKMDVKIKEIQMMARRAREIEKGGESASEGNDVDKENLIEWKERSSQVDGSIVSDDLEKQPSTAPPAMEKYVSEAHVEGHRVESLTEGRTINGISKTKFSESKETTVGDRKFPSGKVSERFRSDSCDTPVLNKMDLSDVSGIKIRLPKKKPVRRMPKIIRSVKEAREYLSLKNEKKADDGDVSATAAPGVGGTGSYVSQRLGKDGEALESSDIAVNVAEHETVEETETDISMLNKELEMDIMPLSNPEMDKDSSVDIEQSLVRNRDVDEMLKRSTGETATDDANQCVNVDFSSSEWLDRIDDVTLKPTDLSEKSDVFPDKVSSYDVSSLVSDTRDGSALHSVNEQDTPHPLDVKDRAEVDGLNGTLKPTTSSDIPSSLYAGDGPTENAFFPTETDDQKGFSKNYIESELPFDGKGNAGGKLLAEKESWLEKNFHEMEPIVNKMSSGFRDSYMVAREKVKQEVGPTLGFKELTSLNDDTELEWMKDDKLREIVFKVRDNELAGRDPFHSMDLDDKTAFFKGLESKVEKENQKLATLHQWLHSNIENIDYGADGISIYDPPEKFIPRWKGPPIDDIPDFLTENGDQQTGSYLQKGNQSTEHNHSGTSQETSITKPKPEKKVAKFPKTVIAGSDGSIKPGKKHGKEYWQHTKKWSRGFLESYNAETDPEMKATMRDIGKDLDRWITEKEIQEAADLMEKIPQRGKEFIDKKINKLKREMELFGPQAVVSKYSEYADDKEEDYLWWLDLPHVLCIEMYTYEGENQEVGFYTLEMAEDLDLEPKPQHLIAFQDPGDCKNFCYIIQAHLDMLGKGKAFIVPQHPKDVYQQAKADGFGVTVIRKGEVKLNIDQPLEEVEELISEIGTKMYHDKIMKERSVDISSLMKGVFGLNKPIKRKRKKLTRKRPKKP
ncbi:hypothetical protein vseg_019077 [Gypsophila vaccaria]